MTFPYTLVRGPHTAAGPLGTAADILTLVLIATLAALTAALVLGRWTIEERKGGVLAGLAWRLFLLGEILLRDLVHWLVYAALSLAALFVGGMAGDLGANALALVWTGVFPCMALWRRGAALALASCGLGDRAMDPRLGGGVVADALVTGVRALQVASTAVALALCLTGFVQRPVLFVAAYVAVRALEFLKGHRAFPSPVVQAVTGLAHRSARGRGTEGAAAVDDRVYEDPDCGNPMTTAEMAESPMCDRPFGGTAR